MNKKKTGAHLVRAAGVSFLAVAAVTQVHAQSVTIAAGQASGPITDVSRVTNNGSIDGGSSTALLVNRTDPISGAFIETFGTIQSDSSSPTVAFTAGFFSSITNGGLIRNLQGAAVSSNSSVAVTNLQGGVIQAAGGNAVSASSRIILENFGAIIGNVVGGNSYDFVTLESGSTMVGDINMGMGDDTFRFNAQALLKGTVSAGGGSDLAILDLTADMALDGNMLQQFETLNTTGAGALRFTGGTAAFNLVELTTSNLTIDSGATLQAVALTMGNSADRLTIAGTFAGQANLSGGDDIFRLVGAQGFSAGVDGGAGADRLEIAVGGTDATPFALSLGSITNFETLDMQSGVAAYSGTSTFGTITINGGRLIGLSGSRLTAETINVAAGGVFGSSGTVVGNVTVTGTLSPGASPGTMTVIGNVSLVNGSASLFELTPTISDQLQISGTLTIAAGATLTLSGTLTPGTTVDLITANGGISGTFSAINKLGGLLTQSANKLSLFGTFATDGSFSPQVNATIGYLNTVLIAGHASPALIAAIPSLLMPTGTSNPAIIERMSPEAYASASQLGTEQALTLVEAARSQAMTRSTGEGLFTFGQLVTNHRQIDSETTQGISGARFQTYGGLAGIGIGSGNSWVGAFIGYLDGRQSIAELGARTDTDGIMAGVQGAWQAGDLRLDALAAYSGGNADTRRTLLGAPITGHYSLRSWIGDVRASYGLPLSTHWNLRPSLGLTGIRTTRGAVAESGNSPFALNVAKENRTRWFFDGDLRIEGGQASGDVFHPYVAIGFQRRLKGRNSAATASFNNVEESYRVPGLLRDETAATARVGMSYDVTERLDLFATYAGEFSDEIRHSASVGLRLKM